MNRLKFFSVINLYGSPKTKQKMLYVPTDFENNLTVDASVDLRAYVSAIAQNKLDTRKQKAPNINLKIDDSPNFQKQVANGQLEGPLATATLKFEFGDKILTERFVVVEKFTGQFIGLHYMRSNSVVIDTTLGLLYFPQLTMQVKPTAKMNAKPQLSSLPMP